MAQLLGPVAFKGSVLNSSAESEIYAVTDSAKRHFTSNYYVRRQAYASLEDLSLFTKTIPRAFTWVMVFLVPRLLNIFQCAFGS